MEALYQSRCQIVRPDPICAGIQDQAVRDGKRNVEIAHALGRHPSTISREKRRNMWPSAHLYTYNWAKYFHRQRQRRAQARKYRNKFSFATF